MKVIWKPLIKRGFSKKYLISNYGNIKVKKTNKLISQFKHSVTLAIMVSLNKNGYRKNVTIHKEVFKHFNKKQIPKNHWILHLDFDKENNYNKNLVNKSRGDYYRLLNEFKNKKRGVNLHKMKVNGEIKYIKWRAFIKYNDKVKTLGYFKTKKEAENAYLVGYHEIYGRYPYQYLNY